MRSKEPKKREPPTSVRIPKDVLARIDAAAAAAEPAPITRHEAILQLLELGLVTLAKKPKTKK